ncbi:F-box domain protein [Aspergillus clavatus NRRL 1]|uniref:F-box domain protein n=1 Tax=Aspergillus clavatus (strain ATCC 1007 / CBS 513.65 / DSM 816 / NCTC 3887 / NRRL 1 / QM 1276 / 107) TaxID=344612 RepID=A1CNB3_ASPCL|nr:F-box domain protein [Aspergillus clavatus NRRL 1]EAW07134.1 F-box domain protein [Aspergillus clavatus NRRL 1]
MINSNNPKTTLLSLPPELHLLITTFLPFPDVIYLRITCSHLYSVLPPLTLPQLLLAETSSYALTKDLYACRYCLRLRPAVAFADRMRCRRRSRHGRDAGKRFCVECGLQSRTEGAGEARYGPGAQIQMQGILYVICITCREFKLGGKGIECVECVVQRERLRRARLEKEVSESKRVFARGSSEHGGL